MKDYSLKAAPAAIDTGTFFVDTHFCSNCAQPIELDERGVVWFHSESKSAYCYGQGD